MSLSPTCPQCGAHGGVFPPVCENELCARYGERAVSDFSPTPQVTSFISVSWWQVSLRSWFIIVVVCALVSAGWVYLGPFGALAVASFLAFARWQRVRNIVATFFLLLYTVALVLFIVLLIVSATFGR